MILAGRHLEKVKLSNYLSIKRILRKKNIYIFEKLESSRAEISLGTEKIQTH